MLNNIKPEYVNLVHVVLLVPALLYAGYKGNNTFTDERDVWFFRFLFVLAAIVLAYHGWLLWKRFSNKHENDNDDDENDDGDTDEHNESKQKNK